MELIFGQSSVREVFNVFKYNNSRLRCGSIITTNHQTFLQIKDFQDTEDINFNFI